MKQIWIDKDKCLGCKTCELQCAVERGSVTKKLSGAIREEVKPRPRVGVFGAAGSSFPIQCRHCQDAACLSACPSGAMQRDTEKGGVFVDQAKCRGCWMCVMSCPFGAVTPLPEYKVAMKCDACMHMEKPACVASCPTQALLYGDEQQYEKVRAVRRGAIAVLVGSSEHVRKSQAYSLDYIREGK